MYGIVTGESIHSLLAYHEKKSVVKVYLEELQKAGLSGRLVKLSKNVKFPEDYEITKYLIPYWDGYVTQEEYEVGRDIRVEIIEHKRTLEILGRLLEENTKLTKKEEKHIKKTMEILLRVLEEENSGLLIEPRYLEEMKEMEEAYKTQLYENPIDMQGDWIPF